jgi:hypothetical protein
MRKGFFLFTILIAGFAAFAQQSKIKVEVTDWTAKTAALTAAFWSPSVEQQLLKQMSKQEIVYMKAHVQQQNWPAAFVASDANSEVVLQRVLNAMNKYQVASFAVKNGNTVQQKVLVLIPYADNNAVRLAKNWSEDFYIVVDESAVQPKK